MVGRSVLLFFAVSMLPFAAIAASPWMAAGGPVVAPSGFQSYCSAGHRNGCASAQPTEARVNEPLLRKLAAFNGAMNRDIEYRSDADNYRVRDRWTAARTTGDCEDIALAKREALVAAGWPAGSLWLAMGDMPGMGLHAVLIIRTDAGDFVLDSLDDRVGLWHESQMRWLVREMPGDRERWRVISSAS
jgi:predicted transglutaminase-like cysteine proteinase